jgi:hypothetical protein
MNFGSALALIHPVQPAAAAFIAITFTAVIGIPAGFLFGLLWEKMTAKISRKAN